MVASQSTLLSCMRRRRTNGRSTTSSSNSNKIERNSLKPLKKKLVSSTKVSVVESSNVCSLLQETIGWPLGSLVEKKICAPNLSFRRLCGSCDKFRGDFGGWDCCGRWHMMRIAWWLLASTLKPAWTTPLGIRPSPRARDC